MLPGKSQDNWKLSVSIAKERKHPFFDLDEYTLINNRYFAGLRRNGNVELDPSGWIETITDAEIKLPPKAQLPRGQYYLDEGNALGDLRGKLHRLLQSWEGQEFDSQSFTACPSLGIASLLTMAVLLRKGVRRIVFETPCYFAAILQAEWLGFDVVLMPTYRRDGYQRPREYERPSKDEASVWWLTQPRVTLGFNQDLNLLRSLVAQIGKRDYVIIDEALDQSFPAHLAEFHRIDLGARTIRLKGFGKPLGLNGYRLAFVLHRPEFRAEMIDCLETFAGAIDVHTLEIAQAVAEDPGYFAAMMRVANHQAVSLRLAAARIAAGSRVTINPLTNGYIGSAVIDLSALGKKQETRRHRFLSACKTFRMPVIIGPSMHFATDPPSEAVRLNFFGQRDLILRSVSILAEIACESFQPCKHNASNFPNAARADGKLKIHRESW